MPYISWEEVEYGPCFILVPEPDAPVGAAAEEHVRHKRGPGYLVHWALHCRWVGLEHVSLNEEILLKHNLAWFSLLCFVIKKGNFKTKNFNNFF